jgi:signal transduction histidine kinase
VHADRDLLRRILINLVVNALRHSGSPDVTVSAVSRPATGTIELSVIDRGHGIPREQQDRVFERFAAFRRSPADEPASDSGLGLPFCKLAVEAMGGTITLLSTPGQGTTVTLTLAARSG